MMMYALAGRAVVSRGDLPCRINICRELSLVCMAYQCSVLAEKLLLLLLPTPSTIDDVTSGRRRRPAQCMGSGRRRRP